jgi:hypothetical protein
LMLRWRVGFGCGFRTKSGLHFGRVTPEALYVWGVDARTGQTPGS